MHSRVQQLRGWRCVCLCLRALEGACRVERAGKEDLGLQDGRMGWERYGGGEGRSWCAGWKDGLGEVLSTQSQYERPLRPRILASQTAGGGVGTRPAVVESGWCAEYSAGAQVLSTLRPSYRVHARLTRPYLTDACRSPKRAPPCVARGLPRVSLCLRTE